MQRILVDSHVIIYFVTNDSGYAARLRNLFDMVHGQAAQLHVTPVVVLEALQVLEFHFGVSRRNAAELMRQFLASPEVSCDDRAAILVGLTHYRTHGLDFVDGYLSEKSLDDGYSLAANDSEIGSITQAHLIDW